MKITSTPGNDINFRPTLYWWTEDGFLDLGSSPVEPTQIRAVSVGHSGLVQEEIRVLDLADLTPVWKSLYGGDTDTRGRENGIKVQSHTKFAIYRLDPPYSDRPGAVIGKCDGLGTRFYYVAGTDSAASVLALAALPGLPATVIFDVLHTIVGSYDEGRDKGRQSEFQRLGRAFLEGRLKKRRRKGSVSLHVEEPTPAPDADGVTRVTIDLGGDVAGRTCLVRPPAPAETASPVAV